MEETQTYTMFIFQKALVNHNPLVNCELENNCAGRLWEMSHEVWAVPRFIRHNGTHIVFSLLLYHTQKRGQYTILISLQKHFLV